MSAERARSAYGLVMPRDRLMVRLAIALENLWFRVRRRPYRAFAHPTARVEAILAEHGLHPTGERRTAFWRAVVYDRSASAGA